MSDMVNEMLERALGYFVELRSLQESYNEQITEICQRYLVSVLNPSAEGGPKVPDQLQDVSRGYLVSFAKDSCRPIHF